MTDDAFGDIPHFPSMLALDGRSVLLFGAGRGIGLQTAHALSQVRASVLCVDRDADAADAAAQAVGGIAFVGDVINHTDVQQAFAACRTAFGRIDVVVDIVGGAEYATVAEMSEDMWDRAMAINLRQAFLVARVASRELDRGGVMAYVASISGLTSSPLHGAYGAAKAGLMSLVQTLTVELADVGIRVNAVAPGGTWTARVEALLGDEGMTMMRRVVPSGRMGRASEIAATILFLVSDLSSYVNGQVLVVDGGGHVQYPYPLDFMR